jgi:hypothetical protein
MCIIAYEIYCKHFHFGAGDGKIANLFLQCNIPIVSLCIAVCCMEL